MTRTQIDTISSRRHRENNRSRLQLGDLRQRSRGLEHLESRMLLSSTICWRPIAVGLATPVPCQVAVASAVTTFSANTTGVVPLVDLLGPEISVSGNGHDIANGEILPGLLDGTNVGTVVQGGAAPSGTYVIHNSGITDLTVGTVTVPAGYTLVQTPGTTVKPGEDTTIKVELNTATTGTFSGIISFTNNDADGGDGVESPFAFTITGTVTTTPPEISVAAGVNIANGDSTPSVTDETDFGTVVQGGTGLPSFFVIHNSGGSPLDLGAVTVPAGFSITHAPAATIAPGSDEVLKVELITTTPGTFSGNVSIANDDGDGGDGVENPFTFAITGTVTPTPPEISVAAGVNIANGDSTPSLTDETDFGTVVQGGTGLPSFFVIHNSGGSPLTLGTVTVPAGFSITHAPAATIAPGSDEVLKVELITTTQGTFSGNVSFTNNDGDGGDGVESPFTFAITGTVVAPPEISVTAGANNITDGDTTPSITDETDFGAVSQGGNSLPAVWVIHNTGGMPLTIGAITIPAGFTITHTPASSIAPGADDFLTVVMPTSTAGTFSGTVSIVNNDADENPFDFAITGTVLAPPEISVTAGANNITDGDTTPSITDETDFGAVSQGGNSLPAIWVIHNTGGMPLTIGAITIPAGFTITHAPASSIAPGADDFLTVVMPTSTAGTFSGTVSIVNNDADENPFDFAITGTVLAPPEISVAAGGHDIVDGDSTPSVPDETDFGTVVQGGAGLPSFFVIHNSGGTALTIGAITVPAGFTITHAPAATVAPGADEVLKVELNTASSGTFSGIVSIANNDADENPFTFTITGTVTPGPEIVVSGGTSDIANNDTTPSITDGTDFGTVDVGSTAPWRFFVIQNTGGSPLTIGAVTVPAGFTLVTPPPASIDPGGTAAIKVQLDTASAGTFTGVVSFTNNDADGGDGVESPFNFTITGTVNAQPPEIDVSSTTTDIANNDTTPSTTDGTDFGTVMQGSTGPFQFFIISNTGGSPLTIGTVTVPAGFTLVIPPPASIAPGANAAIKIQLNTAATGVFSGNVTIVNNDGDGGDGIENPFTFAITGSVAGPPTADAGEDQTVFEGHKVQLHGTYVSFGTPTFLWHVTSDNGQVIPDGTTPDFCFKPVDNGTYTATFTVTDSFGSASSSTTITVLNVAPRVVKLPNQCAVEGAAQSFNIGKLRDPGSLDAPWTIDVNWGDGSADTIITVNSRGPLGVQSHTYDEEGNYVVTVQATDKDGGTNKSRFTAHVADAPLTAQGKDISATVGTSFSGVVASFTDANPNGDISEFSATINWGDGSTSQGTIVANGSGGFDVQGTHTYTSVPPDNGGQHPGNNGKHKGWEIGKGNQGKDHGSNGGGDDQGEDHGGNGNGGGDNGGSGSFAISVQIVDVGGSKACTSSSATVTPVTSTPTPTPITGTGQKTGSGSTGGKNGKAPSGSDGTEKGNANKGKNAVAAAMVSKPAKAGTAKGPVHAAKNNSEKGKGHKGG